MMFQKKKGELVSSAQLDNFVLYQNWGNDGHVVALYVHESLNSSIIQTSSKFLEASLVTTILGERHSLCVGCGFVR